MYLILGFFNIVLDALFPLSMAETEMLSMRPQAALELLPQAPDYSGLAFKLEKAKSIFAYKDERVAKMIWHIKYKKSAVAVRIGGYALWRTLLTTRGEGNRFSGRFGLSEAEGEPAASRARDDGVSRTTSLPEPMVVIPMPITNRRRQERGYNQCELLTDEMEKLEQISGHGRFTVRKDILFRAHHVARQTLKGRRERIESARGIFEVNENLITPELRGAKIVVIDDVITTGRTMFEAVETLKAAGFFDVRGLSLAH